MKKMLKLFGIVMIRKNRNVLKAFAIVIFIISALMLALYFISTFNDQLSKDSAVWAEFGAFLSPLVSMITMILLIYTIQNSNKNEETNRQQIIEIENERFHKEKIELLANHSTDLSFIITNYIKNYHLNKIYIKMHKESSITSNLEKANEHFIKRNELYNEYLRLQRKLESLILLYFQNIKGVHIIKASIYWKCLMTIIDELDIDDNVVILYKFANDLSDDTFNYVKYLYEESSNPEIPIGDFMSLLKREIQDIDSKTGFNANPTFEVFYKRWII